MTAKVVPAKRHVIENQLLTALDNKEKVALIFGESDLDLLIRALQTYKGSIVPAIRPPVTTMINDLITLKDSAFPSGETK